MAELIIEQLSIHYKVRWVFPHLKRQERLTLKYGSLKVNFSLSIYSAKTSGDYSNLYKAHLKMFELLTKHKGIGK